MAQEVGIGTTAAQRSLDQLARGNLLDIRLTAEVRYQFNPGTSCANSPLRVRPSIGRIRLASYSSWATPGDAACAILRTPSSFESHDCS